MTIDIENSSADEPKEKENEWLESTVEWVKETVQALTEDELIAQRKTFLQTSLLDILNIKKFSRLEVLRQSLLQTGVHTVGDILSKTVEEALYMDWFWENSLYVIADKAQKLWLSFSWISQPPSQWEIKIVDFLERLPPERRKKSKVMRYLQSEIIAKPEATIGDIYGRTLGTIADEIRSRWIHHYYVQWHDIIKDLVEIYMRTWVCVIDAQSRLVEKRR